MMDNENLFSSFSAVSQEEWWAKVTKDLKGRDPAELHWQVEEDLELLPFYHADNQGFVLLPQGQSKTNNQWEIAEFFAVDFTQLETTNELILKALMGGTEAIQLEMDRSPSPSELHQLLKGIELSYISTHFILKNEQAKPLSWVNDFIEMANVQNGASQNLKGSIHINVLTKEQNQALQQLLAKALPLFKCQTMEVNDQEGIVKGLAESIHKASLTLDQLINGGVAPEQINQRLQFSILLSSRYFVEIARIRAIRLLWANVLKAYGMECSSELCVEAHLHPESQTEDQHDNMIRATTQAMSAILGGADRITILPANTPTARPDEFTRRIARNVQHLLKMETYLDRVVDPAAGSYYIETLTEKMATAAWKQFQEMG